MWRAACSNAHITQHNKRCMYNLINYLPIFCFHNVEKAMLVNSPQYFNTVKSYCAELIFRKTGNLQVDFLLELIQGLH